MSEKPRSPLRLLVTYCKNADIRTPAGKFARNCVSIEESRKNGDCLGFEMQSISENDFEVLPLVRILLGSSTEPNILKPFVPHVVIRDE